MASVTLVSPSGREFAVSTVKGFVDAVYGRGAVPKVGGVRENYEALQGAAAPVDSPLEHVTLADLQSPTSAARAALRTASLVPVGSVASPITNAATARPSGAAGVIWYCAAGVTPTNAVNGDFIWNA